MDRVIIYRSQGEAELDKLLWSGDGSFFEIGIFCLVFIGVFVGVSRILDNFITHKSNYFFKYFLWIVVVVSVPLTYIVWKGILKLILMI